MRSFLRHPTLRTLAVAAALSGCGTRASDDLEWRNRVYASPDPAVDETPPEAPFAPGQHRDVGDAHVTFAHTTANTWIAGLAMPGDLDGDGLGDLLVWSRRSAPPDIVPCTEGCVAFEQLEVNVFYGAETLGDARSLEPDARIMSWYVHGLRYSVDAAGDVNGDGRADFVVGVGTTGDEQGSAFFVPGGVRLSGIVDLRDAGALLRETGTGTHYAEVAGLGDIDGDGFDDFAIGAPSAPVDAPSASGRLYLYYGRVGAPPPRRSELDADASLAASEGIQGFGKARPVGDVDGDGLGDFLVRDSDALDAGMRSWWLVRGRAARFTGAQEIAAVGTRIDAAQVRGLGDLDGDGRDELGVTVDAEERDVFVIAGRAEWPAELGAGDAAARIELDGGPPRGASVEMPSSLFPAGDVDADGHADLAYGDPTYHSVDGESAGAVYLFRGAIAMNGTALSRDGATAFLGQDWRAVSDPTIRRGYDNLGEAMAAGSDLNGDGIDDLALAGLHAADGGRVYVWLGRESE